MSKSSKLSTAIIAFNVSECVRDLDGNIMQDFLISEDLNHWAGLEVVTVSDLEDWIDMRHGFSDFHKDVHGMRPRFDTSSYTLTEWRETYSTLERIGEETIKMEEAQKVIDVQSFKDSITAIRRSGAKDFMTAIRWMLQAEDINPRHRQDVESFFWGHRILHTDYGQSLLNRISPTRRG